MSLPKVSRRTGVRRLRKLADSADCVEDLAVQLEEGVI